MRHIVAVPAAQYLAPGVLVLTFLRRLPRAFEVVYIVRVPMDPAVDNLRAAWLVKVRWGAAAGQLLAIAVSTIYLNAGLQAPLLVGLSALTIASNAWLSRRLSRELPVSPGVSGTVLVFDTIVLTALLYATGGPSNPFSVLYIVQITVAAVMLGSRWTWAIAACSSVCYALLFALPHDPMAGMVHVQRQWSFSLHLEGMWLALVTAASLTAYFVTRLATALERRESELEAMRETAARQARLAALSTLAAGAAHELATPMATIAVTARELERSVGRTAASAETNRLRDDVQLIRSEVERCGDILRRMSPAGESEAEPSVRISVQALLRDVLSALGRTDAMRARLAPGVAEAYVEGPRGALTAALVSLVRNGLDASPPPNLVILSAACDDRAVRLTVRDQGEGMTPDVLARAGEPFFSTKPPGKGMGLGLFLARSLAERLGGGLSLDSTPGRGTSATLQLRVAPAPGETSAYGTCV